MSKNVRLYIMIAVVSAASFIIMFHLSEKLR